MCIQNIQVFSFEHALFFLEKKAATMRLFNELYSYSQPMYDQLETTPLVVHVDECVIGTFVFSVASKDAYFVL